MPRLNGKNAVAVIGAGPAGLMAADVLSAQGYAVTVFEQKPNAGRKFLLAGRSGLNLTNRATGADLLRQYGDRSPWLSGPLKAFSNGDVIGFAEDLGQPCHEGSGGKMFPVSMRATQLLRAWLARLQGRGVQFRYRTAWQGFGPAQALRFAGESGSFEVRSDATILALGGRSWPRTGSDGQWTKNFTADECAPFMPSNCGFLARLPDAFFTKHAGSVLHDVVLGYGSIEGRGDLMITNEGFEGAPIYAMSATLRDAIQQQGEARLRIRLRSQASGNRFEDRLRQVRPRESLSNQLRRLGLTAPERALVIACAGHDARGKGLDEVLRDMVVTLSAPSDIDRAISTAGGLRRGVFNDTLMMVSRPGVFAAGEMLDWEAPTGGYLLQACFSTGYFAAISAMTWLTQRAG